VRQARGTRSQARGTTREARDEEFREAVRDVSPITPPNRIEPVPRKPAPIPAKRLEDEQAVLEELAKLTLDDDAEVEDDSSYLRPGLPRDILRKLRRTHWVVQDDLDLHGLTGEEAALETARFIASCRQRGLRCVRIVHGKGLRSPGTEPVLKRRVRKLLTRRDDVIAFVEPRSALGGAGAVVVLLDG
jgi:DNA-nicking Smr family endonuclease